MCRMRFGDEQTTNRIAMPTRARVLMAW